MGRERQRYVHVNDRERRNRLLWLVEAFQAGAWRKVTGPLSLGAARRKIADLTAAGLACRRVPAPTTRR
jgi:hypothetical protein